jgi:hypothetical protein
MTNWIEDYSMPIFSLKSVFVGAKFGLVVLIKPHQKAVFKNSDVPNFL